MCGAARPGVKSWVTKMAVFAHRIPGRAEKLNKTKSAIYGDLGDALDYIWKTPCFIENEFDHDKRVTVLRRFDIDPVKFWS